MSPKRNANIRNEICPFCQRRMNNMTFQLTARYTFGFSGSSSNVDSGTLLPKTAKKRDLAKTSRLHAEKLFFADFGFSSTVLHGRKYIFLNGRFRVILKTLLGITLAQLIDRIVGVNAQWVRNLLKLSQSLKPTYIYHVFEWCQNIRILTVLYGFGKTVQWLTI